MASSEYRWTYSGYCLTSEQLENFTANQGLKYQSPSQSCAPWLSYAQMCVAYQWMRRYNFHLDMSMEILSAPPGSGGNVCELIFMMCRRKFWGRIYSDETDIDREWAKQIKAAGMTELGPWTHVHSDAPPELKL